MFTAFVLASVLGAPATLTADARVALRPGPGRSDEGRRAWLARAAAQLGGRSVVLAEETIDADRIRRWLARTDAPLTAAIREDVRRAVDVPDLILFLDDVIARTPDGTTATLPAGRARRAGVLLHPRDVFAPKRPRRYGRGRITTVKIDAPRPQVRLPPAPDGSPLGPRWTARYQQPADEAGRLAALAAVNPAFARRARQLIDQLRAQGAKVVVESTVRPRRRGYLIWGSWWLSRARSEPQLTARRRELDRLNRAWKLDVPIRWAHPDGWRATQDAARRMADTYEVDYATKRGARSSSHYDGQAIDLVAVGLPRALTLTAPDGAERTFDLSDPDEPLDLSLTPTLVRWVERHFGLRKLRGDYPHWSTR